MLRCKSRWVLPVGGTGGCGTKCRAGCCCWTCRQARCPSRCRTAVWHCQRHHSCRQPSALAGLAPLRRRLYCCVNGIGSRRLYGLRLGLYLGLLCRLYTRRWCCQPAQRYRRLRGCRSSTGRLSLRAVAMAGRWCRCWCRCWCWSGAWSGQHQPVLHGPPLRPYLQQAAPAQLLRVCPPDFLPLVHTALLHSGKQRIHFSSRPPLARG